MASYLFFATAEPVNARTLEAVLAAASELCATQPWVYCEPMLPRVEDDGCLHGWSKLNLHPWPEEVEAATGASQHDLMALLQAVINWSRDFALEWIIKLDELEIGRIRAGQCDPAVQDTVEHLISLSATRDESLIHPPKSLSASQLRLFDPNSN